MKIKDIALIGGVLAGAYLLLKSISAGTGAVPTEEYLANPTAYPQGNTIANQLTQAQAIQYAAENPNTYNPTLGILVSSTGLGYSVSAENVAALSSQITSIGGNTSLQGTGLNNAGYYVDSVTRRVSNTPRPAPNYVFNTVIWDWQAI